MSALILIAFLAVVVVDFSFTFWILLHNGHHVSEYLEPPVRWWGGEGVMMVKGMAFPVLLWFQSDISTRSWIGIIAAWTLLAVLDGIEVRKVKKKRKAEEQAATLGRMSGRVHQPPTRD